MGSGGLPPAAFDFNRSRIRFAQAEAHSIEFDFHRITQRRDLDYLDRSAGEQSHGEQSLEGGMIG